MRKHLPLRMICLIILVLTILFPQKVTAAEVEWQIEMKEDGTLEELVSLPSDQRLTQGFWTIEKQGNNTLYRRSVRGWENYEQEQDRLPLKVEQVNYILYKTTKLSGDPSAQSNLMDRLDQLEGLNLSIKSSGIVRETSGKSNNDYRTTWSFDRSSDVKKEAVLFRVVVIDGFLLGISILCLGVVVVFILFVSRLRKVDKIIEEVYSLDNIQLEDLDELENQNISQRK